MYLVSLLFIIFGLLKSHSCSLLSRLKNRYEYLPQENKVDLLAEDLYDFEFTNIPSTAKKSRLLKKMDLSEEDKDLNKTKYLMYDKRTPESDKFGVYPTNLYFLSRPMLKTSFSTTNITKNTWATYFPRKTLPRSSGNSSTLKSYTVITKNERASVYTWLFMNQRQRESTTPRNIPTTIDSPPPACSFSVPTTTGETSVATDTELTKWILFTNMTTKEYPVMSTDKPSRTTSSKFTLPINLTMEYPPVISNDQPSDVTTSKLTLSFNLTMEYPPVISTNSPSRTTTPEHRRPINLATIKVSNITKSKSTIVVTTKMIKRQLVKSYCYRCGLNETRIPMPLCYNTFEGDDQRYSRRKHRFKMKCIRSSVVKEQKNVVFGPWYRGGCFKRFLDVGIEYNERGCRTFVPTKGKSYASIRFAKMESLLSHLNDGCVFSPHASITPFSRAISLFARYHVCVCSQKYCNIAHFMKTNNYLLLIVLFLRYRLYN